MQYYRTFSAHFTGDAYRAASSWTMAVFSRVTRPTDLPTAINQHDSEKSADDDIQTTEKGAHAGSNSSIVDPQTEKSVVRKMDLHVVPLVSALYLLAFLDRSNIG
ncbi:MAG: hypothetical protein Q9214_001772, partial [Letrouitia sp. 1 TL-2023]